MTSPKYDVPVQFLQDLLLQYMCSKTVPTENLIKKKTKEIHFSLFYFHFKYIVDRPDATALARDKEYGANCEFFKLLVIGKWLNQALVIQISDFFFRRINKHNSKPSCISKDCRKYPRTPINSIKI